MRHDESYERRPARSAHGCFLAFLIVALIVSIGVNVLLGLGAAALAVGRGGMMPLQEDVVEEGGDGALVALIRLDGVIRGGAGGGVFARDSVARMHAQLRAVETALDEGRPFKGVILEIDSPGGGVTASDLIHRELTRFRARTKLPVVTLMGDTCASGGVYVASATDWQIAQPTTTTGSIGVILTYLEVGQLLDKIGVASHTVKSGEWKDMGSMFRAPRPEELEAFHDMIGELRERFVALVDEGRPGLSRSELDALADGRVFTAQQALEFGLVDAVGYREDALARVAEMAHVENPTLIRFAPPPSMMDLLGFQAPAPGAGLHVDADSLVDATQPRFYYLRRAPWE